MLSHQRNPSPSNTHLGRTLVNVRPTRRNPTGVRYISPNRTTQSKLIENTPPTCKLITLLGLSKSMHSVALEKIFLRLWFV